MAIFKVQAPNGEVYKVDAPDNATQEQLFRYVKSQMNSGTLASPNQEEEGYQYESEATGIARDVADVGVGLVSGTAKAAGAVVSLGSLVPGLHYVADPLASWLQKGGEAIDEALLSDRQQEVNQELSDRLKAAAGVLGPDASTGEYLDAMVAQGGEAGSFIADHPGQTLNLIATSLPYIFGGGAITKGVKAGASALGLKSVSNMSGITGAALGEGAITAGEVTKNIIENTDSQGEYSTDRLAAIPAGLGTAGISLLSGRMANKAGVDDIDVLVSDKIAGTTTDLVKDATKKSVTKKVVTGAAREGTEEFFQGAQEKIWENVGSGEHPLTDVGGEAVLGTFAGTGQGAGVNLYTGLKENAKNKIDEAAAVAAEKAKAESNAKLEQQKRDDLFIAEANDISSTEDVRAFTKKWSEVLGVTEEEVLQDPRFGVIQERKAAEEAAAIESGKQDLRIKHQDTFPDENEWHKANDSAIEAQRIEDANNPDTELGAAFIQWRKDTNNYNTKGNSAAKAFLKGVDQGVKVTKDDRKAAYLDALDAHAQQQEIDDPHGYQSLAAKAGVTEAEWLAANIEVVTKAMEDPTLTGSREGFLEDISRKQQRLDEILSEESANAEPVSPNPFEGTKKTKRKEAWDQAAELLGNNFEVEHPGLSQLLHEGFTGKKWDAALSKVQNEATNTPQTQETPIVNKDTTESTTEEVAVTAPGPIEVVSNALSGTHIDWSKKAGSTSNRGSTIRPKYVNWLYNNTVNGSLQNFTDDAGDIMNSEAAKELGVAKSTITKLRKDVAEILSKELEAAGYSEQDFLNALREQTTSTEKPTTSEVTTPDNTVSVEDQVEDDGVLSSAGVLDKQTDVGSGMQVLKSVGESKQGDMSTYKEDKDYVQKQIDESAAAEAKALRDFSTRFNALKAKGASDAEWNSFIEEATNAANENPGLRNQLEGVMRVKMQLESILSDAAFHKTVAKAWDDAKADTVLPFAQLPDIAKLEWAASVAEAQVNKDTSSLVKDRKDVELRHQVVGTPIQAQVQTKLETKETPNEGNSESKPKSKKEVKRVGYGNQTKTKSRAGDNTKGTASTKEVRHVYNSEQKKAVKYAEEKIGRDWYSRKRLSALLKKNDLKEFYAFVDKVAKNKVDPAAAKQEFETRAEAEKNAKVKVAKKEKKPIKPGKTIAREYARKMLGRYWKRDNPELVKSLNSKAWSANAFQKEVDAISKKNPELKYSTDTSTKSKASADSVRAMFYKLLGKKTTDAISHRIHFYNTAEEATKALNMKLPKGVSAGVATIEGEEHMVFILNNIRRGDEAAKFMHEVGGHIGMENILGQEYIDLLAAKIMRWSNETGSQESTIAAAVARRVEKAKAVGAADTAVENAEWVAYFLEEATRAGVTPTEKTKAGVIVDTIMQKFRSALRKFIGYSKGEVDNLSTQDIVDMAYGAAKIELTSKGSVTSTKVENSPSFKSTSNERWTAKIDKFLAERFPKDNKGKYVPDGRLSKEDYAEFQKSQWRLEQNTRADLEEEVEMRMRDAETHEINMQGGKFSIDPANDRNENKKLRKAVVKAFGEEAGYQWDTMAGMAKRAAGSLKFLHQVVYEHREDMPGAVKFHRLIREAEKTRNEIKRMVDGIAVRARDLSTERLKAVNSFIEKATTERKWPYDPEIEGKEVEVDKELADAFESDMFNPEERQLIKDVFGHGEAMLARKAEIAKALNIDSSFFGFARMDGPYAPLKRFGNYVTVLKSSELIAAEKQLESAVSDSDKKKLESKIANLKIDGDHYTVSFFHTEGQAKKFRDKNADKYAYAKSTAKAEVIGKGYASDDKVLQKVFGALSVSGLEASVRNEVEKMLTTLYHESLEEANARHSQTRRHGYKGYDTNMIQAFVVHASAEANLISNMEHGKAINIALAETLSEAKANENEDLVRVYNLLASHYNTMLKNKDTPIQDAILSANTFWLLTTSVGYHLQNGTQPWAVSYPILAADFNDWSGVLPEMTKGYKIANSIINFRVKGGLQTEVDVEGKSPTEYQELLLELQALNLLDVGIEADLSNTLSNDTGFKVVDGVSETASSVSYRAFQVARMVEAYNRIATAIAAYELAKRNPKVMNRKSTNPMDYAVKLVQDTQGDFSATGAPELIKKANNLPIVKQAVQYKKFSLMMAWAYTHAFKQAFKGASRAETSVGRRSLMYLLAHTAVLSGVRGLPGIGLAAALYFALFSEAEEPDDTEGALEREIESILGDGPLATALSRGLPTLFGIDATVKLSQKDIFDPAPFADFTVSAETMPETITTVLLGPTAANIINTARAVDYAREDNYWRATEYLMPKGVRPLMEAYRLSTEGYSLRNGDIPVKADKFGKFQLMLHSLGIPVTDVNRVKWTRGEQYEITEHFRKRQSEIRKEYVRATKEKNKARAIELKHEWAAVQAAKDTVRPFFNDSTKAVKRTPITSLIKAPLNQRRREQEYSKQMNER